MTSGSLSIHMTLRVDHARLITMVVVVEMKIASTLPMLASLVASIDRHHKDQVKVK